MRKIAMTVAGSDSGGGAGIQADLKTFQELGVFGTSALTAVTAQNTLGVHDVYPLESNEVIAQMQAVLDDLPVDAFKTGMLFSKEIIQGVSEVIQQRDHLRFVLDPVMIAKGGAPLLKDDAVTALKEELLPLATIVTPNIPEAEIIAGMKIVNDQDVAKAAERILNMGAKAVVMKGGHRKTDDYATDVFFSATGEQLILQSKRIHTKDTHGTGCTYSAAITALLANGLALKEAVIHAKYFIHAAIADGLGIGKGHGPTNHWAYRSNGEKYRKDVIIIDEGSTKTVFHYGEH